MTRRAPRSWRRFFHVRPGQPYHIANSRRGIRLAVAKGYKAIDLDAQVTRDGVLVNTHWLRPLLRDGFRAPKGSRISRFARVDRLTWEQVASLRTRDGYRIRQMWQMLDFAAAAGLERVEVEAKRSRGIARPWIWRDLHIGLLPQPLVVVKVLSTHPQAHEVLAAAKAAGFVTMVSARGPIPTAWLRVVDYVRGRWVR